MSKPAGFVAANLPIDHRRSKKRGRAQAKCSLLLAGHAWYTLSITSKERASRMADVVALVDDLFFQARLIETASKLGVELKTVATGDALIQEALGRGGDAKTCDGPALLIVDLNARHGAIEAIERLRAARSRLRVVAFLSHVQVELAERARAAGCEEVLPRSKFTQNLPAILAQAKPQEGRR